MISVRLLFKNQNTQKNVTVPILVNKKIISVFINSSIYRHNFYNYIHTFFIMFTSVFLSCEDVRVK